MTPALLAEVRSRWGINPARPFSPRPGAGPRDDGGAQPRLEPAVTPSPVEDRYRQAATVYLVYGVVYWLGGLALAAGGMGPRGSERGRLAWFVAGALFVLVFPWLLRKERAWFSRWCSGGGTSPGCSPILVALRAVEVARIAVAPRAATVPVLGLEVPFGAGAAAFCALTVITAVVLARAAWARQP